MATNVLVCVLLPLWITLTPVSCGHNHNEPEGDYEDVPSYYDDNVPLVVYDDHSAAKSPEVHKERHPPRPASDSSQRKDAQERPVLLDISSSRVSYNKSIVRKLSDRLQSSSSSRRFSTARSTNSLWTGSRRKSLTTTRLQGAVVSLKLNRKSGHKGRRTASVLTNIVVRQKVSADHNELKPAVGAATISTPREKTGAAATSPSGSKTSGTPPLLQGAREMKLKPRKLPTRSTTRSWAFELPRSRRRKSWLARYSDARWRRRNQLEFETARGSEGETNTTDVKSLRKRSAQYAVLCLIMACFALLFLLLVLSLIALFIRKRYRTYGKSGILYTTLSDRDPDSDLRPITSSKDILLKRRASSVMPRPAKELLGTQMVHSISEPAVSRKQPAFESDKGSPRRKDLSSERKQERDEKTGNSSQVEALILPSTAVQVSSVPPSLPDSAKRSRSPTRLGVSTASSTPSSRARKTLRIPSPKRKTETEGPSFSVSRVSVPDGTDTPDVVDGQVRGTAGTDRESVTARNSSWQKPATVSCGLRPTTHDVEDSDVQLALSRQPPRDTHQRETKGRRFRRRQAGSSFSDDYEQYSDSDDVQMMFDLKSAPLPTYIRRTMTKTTRRWRDDLGVPSSTLSNTSSASVQDTNDVVIRRPPLPQETQRSCSSGSPASDDGNDSFESKAIRLAGRKTQHTQHTEADCYMMLAEPTPDLWKEVLSRCNPASFVDFLYVMHEDCQAVKIREGRDCDVFRVLGSQGERVLQVRKILHDDDVKGLATSLRIAEELSKLKDTVDNRTSAFFLDTRTYCVRDRWPSILWKARVQYAACHPSRIRISEGDMETQNFYLVSEVQAGWQPIGDVPLEDVEQAHSILLQTTCALAVAEASLEFEHRLLTPDSVLVRATRSPRVEITLCGRIHRVDSHGFKVRVHGFQLSRIRIGSQVEYNNYLSFREHIAKENDRRIHRTYGKIASHLNQRVSKFVPRTNVLWLCYLADWLIDQLSEEADVGTLRQWKAQLKKCNSAVECAESLLK